MRLDVREPTTPIIWRADVLLDGEPLPLCVMADEERGEALVYLEHDGGIDIYTDERGPVLYEVRGSVEIRIRE